tara:strand:- start:1718 stop:2260 length:543 start_codon:yes stop_codon:yes gene_type:complete
MALFYTGKGDTGKSLVGKKKYKKDSPILQAFGDLDELNSLLGLARATLKKRDINKKLTAVQESLFIIQARLAWIMYQKFDPPEIPAAKIKNMEKEIENIEKKIKPRHEFIIPGAHISAAWLDYSRAVARRVERSAVRLNKQHKLPQEVLTYLNRLSSYLYALARLEIAKAKTKESTPQYR